VSERLEELYEWARMLSPEARSAYLTDACAGDGGLEAELRSLLDIAQPAEAFFADLGEIAVPRTAGRRVGHYRLLGMVGSGGMGTVYRAHDSRLNRDVALKFLPSHLSADPQARDRLLVEARAAAALEHPNVCVIHEIGETTDGRPFIAMACHEGETLRERLGRGALSPEEAASVATQIARGLRAAHTRGIVHRDVKPGNVMLCADGTVRLLDFGLAKLADVTLTGPGVRTGTVAYMSPEQARGDVLDARTDLWSLGVVLYEMLAGERPFRGGNDPAVIQAIVHERPEPLRVRRPETPGWLSGVVERLLEKEPERRYGSAAELLHDLTSPPSAARPRSLRGWRPAGRPATVGAVGILSMAALWSLAGKKDAPDIPEAPNAHAAPTATAPAPAIAVLPFSVRGEGLELWREGMVDLLSTGLDGAGGLRAIHSRTLLARWSEEFGDRNVVDLASALAVARQTGARYAMVGSVIAAGPRIRLVVDIYDLASGHSLGQPQVEGSPDSILGLVDRLGMQTVALILEQDPGELPPIELAGVTTTSLVALKAYLEGQARFRRSEFRRASEAWERAVRADSTFALAYLNLGEAYGWDEARDLERAEQAWRRSLRLIERLPPREKALVRARVAARASTAEGVPAIEAAVRTYPDDAGAWYTLGELYYHNPRAMRGPEDVERAFRQAAELQPATAPYRAHLVDLAFDWQPDSARIAHEVGTYERLAPRTTRARAGRTVLDLVFGDPPTRARARAALDTLSGDLALQTYMLLGHPRFAAERESVYRAIESRLDPDSRALITILRFNNLGLVTGRVRDALGTADRPWASSTVRYCGPVHLSARGLPVPDRTLEEKLALSRAEGALLSDPGWVTCAAAYAARHGRWRDHAALLSGARELEMRQLSAGDTASARNWGRAVREADAHSLWRRGRKEEALRAFEDVLWSDARGWWALSNVGQLALELGRLDLAERVFRALWSWGGVPARLHLARLLERTGRTAEAREAFEYVVLAWRNADPELKPWVDEAREGIARLSRPAN
jgi:tetratricopeptide (TPR) repeat protein/TolB-like protein